MTLALTQQADQSFKEVDVVLLGIQSTSTMTAPA
jgi:hypothetical protein